MAAVMVVEAMVMAEAVAMAVAMAGAMDRGPAVAPHIAHGQRYSWFRTVKEKVASRAV